MKEIKKLIFLTSCLMAIMTLSVPIYAAEGAAVIETYTTEDEIILYIKGVENAAWEAEYQVGITACEVESLQKVREMQEPIYTLILWNNSLSLMEKAGDKVREALTNIVANRISGEKFSLIILSEERTPLVENSDDYALLKQTIEGVEGEEKESPVIRHIYEAVLSLNQIEDYGYKRIILISDGLGSVGDYTIGELNTLLEETPYPIYTLGAWAESGKEELQDMFAFSRSTDAAYFNLDETEDIMPIVQVISADYDVLQIRAGIPEPIRDGSRQNSRLVLTDGISTITVQSLVTLPFLDLIQKGDEPEAEGAGDSMPVWEEAETNMGTGVVLGGKEGQTAEDEIMHYDVQNIFPLIVTGIILVIFALIIVFIVISRKKGKNIEPPIAHDPGPIRFESPGKDKKSNSEAGSTGPVKRGNTIHIHGKEKGSTAAENDMTLISKCLVYLQHGEMRVPLDSFPFTLGRIGTNYLIMNPKISDKHAEIRCRSGRYYLVDTKSGNHTRINNCMIQTDKEYPIEDGDEIMLADERLVFCNKATRNIWK